MGAIQALRESLPSIYCPSTGRPIAAILLKANPSEQSIFCLQCLLDKAELLANKKTNLILVDELIDDSEKILREMMAGKEGIKQIEAETRIIQGFEKVKAEVHKLVDAGLESQQKACFKDIIKYIEEEVFSGNHISQTLPNTVNSKDVRNFESCPELNLIARVYVSSLLDKQFTLQETLQKQLSSGKIAQLENNKLISLCKGLTTRYFGELLFLNKFAKKFSPESDIVCRNTQLQQLYQYMVNGNLSLSLQVRNSCHFFGIANYCAQNNYRVKYTISLGESKNELSALLVHHSTLKVETEAERISTRQTDKTSADLFPTPVFLEGGVWYNISMNILENTNINMYWGTSTNADGSNTMTFPLANDNSVSFKGGLDDNCGNGTFAHIYADFFIA